MDDDQDQGDEGSPILLFDSEEESPDNSSGPPGASPGESSMIMDDSDEDTPAESADSESISPERESSMFVHQPNNEADDAGSSQPDEDQEDEEPEQPEQQEGTHSPENGPARSQSEGAGGNFNYEMESSSNSSDDAETCTRACLKQARTAARKLETAERRNQAKDRTIENLKRLLKEAKQEITRLKQELKQFTGSDSPDEETSWQEMLREYLASGGNYENTWKSSYRALNMPIDPNMAHPQVRFTVKDDDEDISSRQSSPNDLASVSSDEEVRATRPLPDHIIYQILTELLTKDGLVHCFSRLDPFCPPDEFPSEESLGRSSSGVRGRFFISKEERSYLSLTHDTEDPNTVLAALCVSRQFCWYGIHIFYSKSTFAFSSLGELDRFATGIGAARWARAQHLELTWLGGKCVSFNLGRSERLNRRTSPLAWFCEAASLKTLCIHVRESHRSVVRRRHEPREQKLYMTGKTAGQPNYRMTRSMRGLMGIDYIYQLRGMYWIHVYDLDKELVDPDRNSARIRDESFRIDLERVTTQEKVKSRSKKSKLEKLDPLFPEGGASWKPSRRDFDLIREIYTEDTGYDNRTNDLDYDATSSQGTIEGSDESGVDGDGSDDNGGGSDDDEDGSDDDSSGPSLHPSPGPSRRRRLFTPAPGPVDFEGEELSTSGDESLNSVSDGPDQSDSGSHSGDSDADSATTEGYRRSRVNEYVHGGSQEPE